MEGSCERIYLTLCNTKFDCVRCMVLDIKL